MPKWKDMTDEQKQAHMEKQKFYRHRKKARELGISLEEYRSTLSRERKNVSVKKKEESGESPFFGWSQYPGIENKPDTYEIVSKKRPWLTFVMRKKVFVTDQGFFMGYATADIKVDHEVADYYRRLREEG